MCKTNGDGQHHHANGHEEHGGGTRVRVDRGVLDKNDQLAEYNAAGSPAGGYWR